MIIVLVYMMLLTPPDAAVIDNLATVLLNKVEAFDTLEECMAASMNYNTTHTTSSIGDTLTACMPVPLTTEGI
jgi:hypothetical protein